MLRPVKSEDLPFILEWENNPEMWPISETPGPFDEETIRDFIEMSGNLKNQGQERWVFFDYDKIPLGLIDLFSFDPQTKSAGIGIMVANSTDRKKGYAFDAIMTLIENLNENKKVSSLQALIYTNNEPSLKLFAKCGFEPKGTKFYRGRYAIQFVKNL